MESATIASRDSEGTFCPDLGHPDGVRASLCEPKPTTRTYFSCDYSVNDSTVSCPGGDTVVDLAYLGRCTPSVPRNIGFNAVQCRPR